jgi:ATP-dependent protease ClpP protease subunit
MRQGVFFLEEVEKLGAAGAGEIHCVTIIGQVEGHQILPDDTKTTKYEHVMPLLAAIEETPEIRGVLILLNTVGGDLDAGLGIAELIAGMRKPTASLILGGGHSIGAPLAVAARRSFIAPSAAVTLHPVRLTGVVLGAPQTYRYLTQMQERILSFLTAHSRISRQALLDYMMATDTLTTDMGTVLGGAEAVECGLIDSLGGLSDALRWLHREITDGAAHGKNFM